MIYVDNDDLHAQTHRQTDFFCGLSCSAIMRTLVDSTACNRFFFRDSIHRNKENRVSGGKRCTIEDTYLFGR